MKDYIEERAVEIAGYIIETKATVRQTAKQFGISKSTVHKDCTDRLQQINPSLARADPECAGCQQAGTPYPGRNGDQGEVSASWRVKLRNEKEKNKTEKNKTENIRQENRERRKSTDGHNPFRLYIE